MAVKNLDMLMPAGTYLIGDPCYIIPNEDWDNFVETVHDNQICKFTLSSGEEILVWYSHTEFGDGEYTAESYHGEHQLPVDSGTIGIVQKFNGETPITSGVFEYSTQKKFTLESKDDSGKITIGPWEIQTGDEMMEDIDELDFDFDYDEND